MARYNPHHEVGPIFKEIENWSDKCLKGNGSMFSGEELWTSENLDQLNDLYVNNLDESRDKSFLDKLEGQLREGSSSCKQLMAEILWVVLLFSSNDNIKKETKRSDVKKVWSWSDGDISDDHEMLSDELLVGMANTSFFNVRRWQELAFFITALRDLKSGNVNEILSDPWVFGEWLNKIEEDSTRQFRNMLSHLLFPDTFERITTNTDKCAVLMGYQEYLPEYEDEFNKGIKKVELVVIDKMLFKLREKLEEENGPEVDFYFGKFRGVWKKSESNNKINKPKPDDRLEKFDPQEPENIILYGPPGTGKTYRLRTHYLPYYEEGSYEFITFHQNYSYEDFIEGIRPKLTDEENVIYEIEDGIFKKLCERAKNEPTKGFALFVDEINRGNISKIFGELITLIELDKRIKTDESGNRIAECEGIEVKLPYSKELFGVPANVSIIGTMNTADRSIALLDSALRRRFQFEEIMPNSDMLNDNLDDGEGDIIDLQLLLKTINERISDTLNRDQTIGHSYFYKVKNFDSFKHIFAHQILPLLQEYFYDDREQISQVLTEKLITKDDITPEEIRKIYEE